MPDNQTTANGHKLVAMKPQDRLAYLLRLERSHSLSALIADLGLDASTLYEDKDVRLNLFVGLLHVPVCSDGQGPDHYATGKNYFVCQQNVAAPKKAARPICVYCGMDRGIVPLEEIDDNNPVQLARLPWVRLPDILPMAEFLTGEY